MTGPDIYHKVGTALGFILGFTRSVVTTVTEPEVLHQFGTFTITWADVFQTALLACVGATIGFFTTSLLKWGKSKIFKHNQKP